MPNERAAERAAVGIGRAFLFTELTQTISARLATTENQPKSQVDWNTQHRKKKSQITAQKSQVLDHFCHLFESWVHPGEDLGAKGKQTGSQKTLWADLGEILVPIGHHLVALLNNESAKRLFWHASGEFPDRVTETTSKFVEFPTLPNLWIELTLTR